MVTIRVAQGRQSCGRLVPGWLEQRLLLEAEQVVMKDDRHVDLKKCRWDY